MLLTDCGYENRHEPGLEINRPTGCGDYLIILIRSPAFVYIGKDLYNVKGNSLLLLKDNTPHYYGSRKEEFVNDFVRFSADADDVAFIQRIGIPFNTIIEFQHVNTLSDYMKKIVLESWSKNDNASESIYHLMRLLLLKISDYHTAQPSENTEFAERLTMLRHNISSNLRNNWSVEHIAASLFISPSYLHYKYKSLFGNSIKKDIILFRLDYSKQLLTNTKSSILEVANKCGFENDVHFMRIFKKYVGCTPTQYRKSDTAQKQVPAHHPSDN